MESASSTRPLLAVIPVRGQSKRIPRKWAALVNGRPLLQHTIDTARAADGIDRLAVCTEDSAVAAYARLRGVDVIDRPVHLSADDVPLAEVARWIATECDDESDIAILQPTCPLLTSATLTAAIAEFRRLRFDWMITVSKSDKIYWQDGRPLTARLQSQALTENPRGLYRESGAVQIGTGDYWRTGAAAIRGMIPIDPVEALDIDTHADLAAARAHLGRRTIGFHVVASDEKGSGHLRRCLQLSDALSHHDVVWFPASLDAWALDMVDKHGFRFSVRDKPDLVVIDALEAASNLAPQYASQGIPTVVFEPDGANWARRFADLVIDEFDTPELAILRPEFLCLPPYGVQEKAQRVLVGFGGTDAARLNDRMARIIEHGCDATVDIIRPGENRSMAEAMCSADLFVGSQGRTVLEAAAVGVPMVSMAANERESRHGRVPGVTYLGLHVTIPDALVVDVVNKLLQRPDLRAEMSRTARTQIDGKGLDRIVNQIEGLLRGL